MAVARIPIVVPILLLALLAYTARSAHGEEHESNYEFFEKRIRPILVDRCLECHGASKKQGGLRLDSRAGWQRGGDSGAVIVPGKPDESPLLQALRYDPTFVEMPPTGQLPDSVIRDFERWIADGAIDPRDAPAPDSDSQATNRQPAREPHWCYQPLTVVAPPPVARQGWPRAAIDRYVLARLESVGLKPAEDADRATLIRRLYFDLVGLPPSPEEVAAFQNDPAPRAVEHVVDSLLSSPHFGERWGRHWLDIVRFGESVTLRGSILRDAWRFRDYIIEAINADRPLDQLIREHVAGDLLPADDVAARQRQCVATTFLGLGNWNLEEQDKQQLRMDVVDEQLDTIGKAFLAQTIGCARCHDHKFDPISARDYYALAAILRNTTTLKDANVSEWLTRPLPLPPDEEALLARHEAQIAELELQVAQQSAQLAQLEGESGLTIVAAAELPGIVVDDVAARAVGHWQASQSNKPYIGTGYVHDQNDRKGEKTLTFEPQLPASGRYEVRLAYTHGSNRTRSAPVTIFSAEGEKTLYVDQQQPPAIDRRFVSLGTYRFEAGGQCFVIVANDNTAGHVVADAVQFLSLEEADTAASGTTSTQPTGDDASDRTAAAIEQAHAQLVRLKQQLAQLRAQGPIRPTYLAVDEEPHIEEGYVYIRGNVHQPGEPVNRGVLEILPVDPMPAMPHHQSGRRELALWLTHPQNPLTPRVLVNRAWHWLFGRGLVQTVDNFGTTGELPSHPELLDYLAREFVDDGWSLKRLVRRIVLSRTYQLAAAPTENADPENRLLSRANRRRLDAECLRDAMLAISGELDWTAGGSTIKPGTAADYHYRHDDLRRSVYTPVLRNSLPSIFEAFDFADPSTVTGRRNTSTVVQQSLFFLHDPFVLARAEQAARRLLAKPLATEHRVDAAFHLVLGRLPTSAEREVMLKFLSTSANSSLSDDEVSAWSAVIQSLFASSDFRYVN